MLDLSISPNLPFIACNQNEYKIGPAFPNVPGCIRSLVNPEPRPDDYQLRRLRLHDMIERIPGTHRYRVTEYGLRAALFFTRTYNRILRPGLA